MDQVQEPGHDTAPALRGPNGGEGTDAIASIGSLVRSIASEFELAMGRPERVADHCSRLHQLLHLPPTPAELEPLRELIPLLSRKGAPLSTPLFELLSDVASACHQPWPFLAGMLAARDHDLGRRALEQAARLAENSRLLVDEEAALLLAEQVEREGSALADDASLRSVAELLRRLPMVRDHLDDPVLEIWRHGSTDVLRRVAARILDLDGQPAPARLAREHLGPEAHHFLRPYLDFTRASHLDLLHLGVERDRPPSVLPSLRRTEALCGAELLREVIATLGWQRINRALEARPVTGISISGSLPFMVSPAEAQLIESHLEARRTGDFFLLIGHGGTREEPLTAGAQGSAVALFRSYNLAHAEVLVDILDVAPLTPDKVRRIIERMDRIVSDFRTLFAAMSEECTVLPAVYAELRQRVVTELEREGQAQLSPELTRLVQMFEDPGSLADVRTLHGLKRYLHQRGLKLGLRLVAGGAGTTRTLSLVVTSRQRILRALTSIQYVDFEAPGPGTDLMTGAGPIPGLPFPVSVLAEGCALQLLHGQEIFPSMRVFCYGNEVHYYIAFRNHPAFLRIDFSPPLKGGMIDLEYFGVSNYELSTHPNPSLDAIQLFFRRLDFDLQTDGTRLHARYDKERALDLGALCDKAGALCRLVPYLMDVDWIIGNLDLDREARLEVARAWADRLALWGALPTAQLLTRDRRGILCAVETGPAGERDVRWSGEGPYRDRFSVPATNLFHPLRSALEELGLDLGSASAAADGHDMGPIALERALLHPLREAVARGELAVGPDGFHPSPPERFQRRHEAEVLAEILGGDDATIESASRLARMVAPLERSLRFRTTGSVNGYEVQRARLPLLGESLGLHVLRDARGMARLAVFSHGESISRRRGGPNDTWRSNESSSALELALLLRASNYLPPGVEPPGAREPETAERIRESFQRTSPFEPHAPLAGECVLGGLRAAPGRAVGKVRFGAAGRTPADFAGAVLVAASVRPEDSIFLRHAAGIVSTGGGILSHAGLIAVQLRKPALIISGQWQETAAGARCLLFSACEYKEEIREIAGARVVLWHGMKERAHCLREEALVVVDADAGILRVIGHDREALALHEELRLLAAASRNLLHATDEEEILRLRGRELQARYQIEKLLGRLRDPIVARHAVHEILLGEAFQSFGSHARRVELLSFVLGNAIAGPAARDGLLEIAGKLSRRCAAAREKAESFIPTADSTFEILWLRLTFRHLHRLLAGTAAALAGCGLEAPPLQASHLSAIDRMAASRLEELRLDRLRTLGEATGDPRQHARRRHLWREIGRLDLLLGGKERCPLPAPGDETSRSDDSERDMLAERRILGAEDGGLELHPLIGWKAANLAEIEQLGGPAHVPPWFAVTSRAFDELLVSPLEQVTAGTRGIPKGSTLQAAIEAILARSDLGPAQQSAQIRQLWEQVTLPGELIAEVLAAYHRLNEFEAEGPGTRPDPAGPFVAVRSSSLEEDTESAARAGEFDTFLFIQGADQLLAHLRRAWSGLWTERAIHSRKSLGMNVERTGGGVIVQRIVRSRVSGVLGTVNIAEGEMREMVINAGLGLGEGIVSGIVAADQIVVAKGEDPRREPLRCRYQTSDKQQQFVFNQAAGFGTVCVETLYHQRLRPALEYVELAELVATAADLEATYGYPLDIEFGIEGTRLWILQVRPMAVYLPALRETLDDEPFPALPRSSALPPEESGS